MSEYKENSDRKYAASLLRYVLNGQMSVRQAMLNYPKDTEDKSLVAAYHALIHFDADEDLRARDLLYREEQDEYIDFLAQTLDKEQDLPQNIIDNYNLYYDSAPIPHKDNISGKLRSFFKNLNVKRK